MASAVRPPRPTLSEALASADWETLLPLLVADALRRLRRPGHRRLREGLSPRAAAEELVQNAIASALSGRRVWPDDLDLLTFLRGLLWSEVGHKARDLAKRPACVGLDQAADARVAASGPDDSLDAGRTRDAIERAIAGDEDMVALFGAMADGHRKRADLAEVLGWTVERVSATKVKINRRLASMGLLSGGEES